MKNRVKNMVILTVATIAVAGLLLSCSNPIDTVPAVSGSIAAGPDNSVAATSGQNGGSCCNAGTPASPPVEAQANKGCCSTGNQSNPVPPPSRTSGCGCGR